MLGSRGFYCIFGDDEIFKFQAKKQRDEMYKHGCKFISAADAYKRFGDITQVKYHQFKNWLPTFIKTHKYVQLSLFDLLET